MVAHGAGQTAATRPHRKQFPADGHVQQDGAQSRREAAAELHVMRALGRSPWGRAGLTAGTTVALPGSQVHTGYMGRIIGTILGAILAIWLAVTIAGEIFATLKTFLIIALIAMAVFIVVWLVARGARRG
jgi:hypothetical protein